jgi:hypothetical protein
MKNRNICKIGIVAAMMSLALACAPKEVCETSIHPLEGMEIPVYYTASTPLTEGYDGELAVVMIQGWHGGVQVLKEQLALQNALSEAYVISPMYPRTEMMETYNIAKDGRAIWNDSWPLDLTKPGVPDDDWRGGGDAGGTELSSFDVIDTLFTRLSNRKLFPNLKRIALVGFSAGGQFVGRYVAVGKGVVGDGISLVYAAMAPSTFLRLDAEATWHYGLKNRPRYCRAVSEEQMLENLRSRRCLHACGELDTLEKNLDKTVFAMKQGENRLVRFENFCNAVSEGARWREAVVFHTFEGIGHQAAKAYVDPFFIDYVKGTN